MEFKDVSPEIASVAQNYSGPKLPSWILKGQDLLLQFWQWLQEWLNALLRHKSPGDTDSSSFSTFMQFGLYAIGVAAVLTILYLLWRRVARNRESKIATTRGAASVDKILDSRGYRLEAEKMSSVGDFKGACRAVYLCLLQNMHEKSVAAFSPAKTNYEYRYLLAAYPNLLNDFMQIANIVEFVWFGNKQAETDDYSRCLTLLHATDAELEKLAAAASEKAARLRLQEEA